MGGFPFLSKFSEQLIRFLFPPACPLCLETLPPGGNRILCSACEDGIVRLPENRCPRCLLPFNGVVGHPHLCPACHKAPPAFATVYALGGYEKTLRSLIQEYKFHQRINLDRVLATLLSRDIPAPESFDLIVPVPMHPVELRQRSYNQSLLLARELGRCLEIPVADRLLSKHKQTAPQHLLAATKRRENLINVFRVNAEIHAAKVLLVDDVMTTGATLQECARVLLQHGARQVCGAVIARVA